MEKAIKELFGQGILKRSEHSELYDEVLAKKEYIEDYFLIINRTIMINEHEQIIYLCAPILELVSDYNPYANLMPSPEEVKQHAASDPAFAEVLGNLANTINSRH